MKSGAAFIGFAFSGAIGIAVGFAIGNAKCTSGTKLDVAAEVRAPDKAKPGEPAKPGEEVFKVPIGKAFTKGPADALVTIVEISDFECPFCSRVNPTLAQIQKTYKNDVRIAFKHNPLPFHKNAKLAAEWSIAAGQQEKFFEYHDKLFANQKALLPSNLESYATELGLDVNKMKAFVESGEGKRIIDADQGLASKIGARGTPAFFVNGVKLTGAQPFDKFKAVIDVQLAKAKKLVASGVSRSAVYEKIIATGRTTAPPPPPRPKPPPATRQKVDLVDGTPFKGGKQPLVTIVAWSDFECPFCGRVNPTLKQIKDTYGDKVQVQFRHQPLSFHKNAMGAAKASMAAHRQGKFWEYHDVLFKNQRALGADQLEGYAKQIGLNVAKFKKDMADPAIDAQIKKDMADGTKYGARGTPTLFVNGIPVRGAQPFPAFKQHIDAELKKAEALIKSGTKRADVYQEILKREAGKAAPQAAAAPKKPPQPTGPVKIDLSRAPFRGKKNAPVQVVVYSDFECPFCGRVNPSVKKLEEEYGDKVMVAFKHFPLSFHKNAELAAVASLAAHRQGKFWPMHDKLFANQRALQRTNLVSYAKELGLDVKKFEKDLDDSALKQWVKDDTAQGSKNGVTGTPATYINGRKLSGAVPYEKFKAMVEEELKK